MLTKAQIEVARANNAFEAVQKLRGNWLRVRGSSQMPQTGRWQKNPTTGDSTFIANSRFEENKIWAYLNDQRLGGVEELRNIEVAAVQYIRFLSPAEASTRWGMGHTAGAIQVSTRPLEQ